MDEVLSLMVGGVTFRRGQRCYGKRPFCVSNRWDGTPWGHAIGDGAVGVDGEFGGVMR